MLKDPNRLYDIPIARGNVGKYKNLGYDCQVGDIIRLEIHNLISSGSVIKLDLICDYCGIEFQRQARQIKERLAGDRCCSKCSSQELYCKNKLDIGKSKQQLKDERDLQKYGKIGLSKEEKTKQTNLERYDTENPFGSLIIISKIKKTKLDRYGDENYTNLDKAKQTNLSRHGVENAFISKHSIEKIKKTKLDRYGDENYTNLDKAKQTNLERYGVEYNFQREDIKKVIKESYKKYSDSQKFYDFRLKLREEKNWGEFREDTSDWEKYKFLVWGFTERNELHLLENYEKRGLAGVDGCYQLDHKVSIKFGFDNNVNPEIIGHINNLEFIPWKDNLSKGIGCSITLEQLLNTVKDLI